MSNIHSQVQTVALRAESLSAFENNNVTGSATFTLTLAHRTTAAIAWGAPAEVVQTALEGLRSVAKVEVSRSGDETDPSPALHWGVVYTIKFVAQMDAPHVPELVVDTSGLYKAHAVVHTVQEGATLATMSPTYTALRPGKTYAMRVKARNAEGWGPYGAVIKATTPAIALVPGAPTAVLAGGCGYTDTTLSLDYEPPFQDGGSSITHYRVEWDTDAGFTQSSGRYQSADLEVVHEVQTIQVDFRSADVLEQRSGTFTLEWGGVKTGDLPWDVAAKDLAIAIHGISGLDEISDPVPVAVTRTAYRQGYRWDVTFKGLRGDLGLLEADGTLITGDDPKLTVVERTAGVADIVPGDFTFEQQSIAIRAYSKVSGTFRLSFEGKRTVPITFDEQRETFKYKLEALSTIHCSNVRRIVTTHHGLEMVTWQLTFAYLRHEVVIGAGNLGKLLVVDNNLGGNDAEVVVSTMVQGTNPLSFDLDNLEPGLDYYVRVAAQNAQGFGPASAVTKASPRGQPSALNLVTLGVDGGTSLEVNWAAPDQDGGAPVQRHKISWYRSPGTFESQIVTTSADKGTSEEQAVVIGAGTNSIAGYFTLAFKGEQTDNLRWDAPATGAQSVKEKLERLSTIGTVDVTRSLSRTAVPGLRVDVLQGHDYMNVSVTSSVKASDTDLLPHDIVFVAGIQARVKAVSESRIELGTMADHTVGLLFGEGDGAFDMPVEKWSYGYVYSVTFSSHNGPQPLLTAAPSDNWSGTDVTLNVVRTLPGLQPISGTFRLGFRGHTSAPLPHDASAAAVEHALESLRTISDVRIQNH